MNGEPDRRAEALRGELAAIGVAADVAAENALAVVRLRAWPAGGVAPLRTAIVERARACGFTHAALELTDAVARGEGHVA